jgi:site-specific DNA recombinase
VDEAESATTDQRPQFQEMIAECKKDTCDVDCVIVWKLSRFARNRFDSTAYKKLLSRKGIRVVSVSEPIDDSPEGMVLEGVIEIFDDWYSRLLSWEVLRGQKEAAKQGFHTGGQPPYGYQLKKVMDNSAERTVWEVNPSEAEAVRKIYKLFNQGLGYGKIIQELEKQKIKPRKTPSWSKVSMHDILRKDCYTGERTFNVKKTKDLGRRTLGKKFLKDESEWVQVAVPKIISEETFQAARERLAKKRKAGIARQPGYLLSGLLKCGKCGSNYSYAGSPWKGKHYFYYRCATKMNKGLKACDNRNLKGHQLDQAIIRKVSEVIFSEQNIKKFYSFVHTTKDDEKKEIQLRLEQNQKGLKEVEKKLANYRKAIEQGVDISLVIEPMNALKAEKQKLEDTSKELQARLEGQPKPEAFKFDKKAYDRFMEMTDAFFKGASPDNVRAFLQKFIQKIVVLPDKLSIIYYPPIISKPPKTAKGPQPTAEDLLEVTLVPKRGVVGTKKGELFQVVNSKRVPKFGAKMHPLCTHLQNFAKIRVITWGKGQNSILKRKDPSPSPTPGGGFGMR